MAKQMIIWIRFANCVQKKKGCYTADVLSDSRPMKHKTDKTFLLLQSHDKNGITDIKSHAS